MAATTISLKRSEQGTHTFESFKRGYALAYTPDPHVRGAFGYTLFTDLGAKIAEFGTLNEARKWVTQIGFERLDALVESEDSE